MKGNSFALGQAIGNGGSYSTGPGAQEFREGWHIRPASIWDHLEPGTPA